jgi:phosphate transport system substrate-binding protein
VPKARVLVAALLLAGVAACEAPTDLIAVPPIGCTTGSVTAQGSSAQTNAVNAWIKDYQVNCKDAAISYASVGSGAGLRDFLAGTGAFAGSDSPVPAADLARATARCGGPVLHLPMVVGPIALAYNVAGVDDLRLAPATVAGIFAGRVKAWNAPAIRRDNPDVTLPATPIRTVHRSDNSGTTDNFTRFLVATALGEWQLGSGPRWPVPGGLGKPGSNQVVDAIERTDGAIGYIEGSYAGFHHLPAARIGNAAGDFAALTESAAGRTVAGARITGTGGDLQLAIDYRVATPGAYPLVQVTYEVVCRTGTPSLAKSFLAYASSQQGQAAAARLGYAPLPGDLRAKVAGTVARL